MFLLISICFRMCASFPPFSLSFWKACWCLDLCSMYLSSIKMSTNYQENSYIVFLSNLPFFPYSSRSILPSTSHNFGPLFSLNPLSTLCTDEVLFSVGLSTGVWLCHQGLHPYRELTPPVPKAIINNPLVRGGTLCLSTPHFMLGCCLACVYPRFMYAVTVSECSCPAVSRTCTKECYCVLIHDLWLLPSFCSLFSTDPGPWKEGVHAIDISFRSEHSPFSYYLHFDQLWVSVLITVCCKTMLLWWRPNDKSLGAGQLKCSFSSKRSRCSPRACVLSSLRLLAPIMVPGVGSLHLQSLSSVYLSLNMKLNFKYMK